MNTIPWEHIFAGLSFALGMAFDLRRPLPTRGRTPFDRAADEARRRADAKESGERERPAAE